MVGEDSRINTHHRYGRHMVDWLIKAYGKKHVLIGPWESQMMEEKETCNSWKIGREGGKFAQSRNGALEKSSSVSNLLRKIGRKRRKKQIYGNVGI